MANENGYVFTGTLNVTATLGSASELLTEREIECQSVFLFPKAANSGNVAVVDDGNDALTFIIPATGLTLPISNPAKIKVSTDNSGDDVDWIAV